MPFHGKCGFCDGNGHNIKMCFHPDKMLILNRTKTELGNLRTKREIKDFIDRLSTVHLEILASDINIARGTPTMFLRKCVKNYYVCDIELRNRRWRTYLDDLEEAQGGYHTTPPHSLFRRCVEVISSLGSRLFRVVIGRDNARAQYTPLDAQPSAPRPWKIIPSLGCVDKSRKIECPICMEMKPMINVVTPQCSCNHSLCKGCFFDVAEKSQNLAPRCPLCRANIQTVSVYDANTYNEYCDKYLDE